jgi:hypothetical protein
MAILIDYCSAPRFEAVRNFNASRGVPLLATPLQLHGTEHGSQRGLTMTANKAQ